MTKCPLSNADDRRAHASRGRRRAAGGYSFAEVLFAVAVLGIGFIMIAAIYPVAIQQTQLSLEETVGAVVSRNGVGLVGGSSFMNQTDLPETSRHPHPSMQAPPRPSPDNPGRVFSFRDARIAPPNATTNVPNRNVLWDSVRANLISRHDPRYAFVPMYIRNRGSLSMATVICIAVQNRNRDNFEPVSTLPSNPGPAELEPHVVRVTLDNQATGDTIQIADITTGPLAEPGASGAAVEGAYVVISDDGVPDQTGTPFTNENGRLNGRVYRLGAQIAPGQFQLVPGDDMKTNAENVTDAVAFIIGRGYRNPDDPSQGFEGPSMAIYSYVGPARLD